MQMVGFFSMWKYVGTIAQWQECPSVVPSGQRTDLSEINGDMVYFLYYLLLHTPELAS